MVYKVETSKRFRKDIERCIKRGLDEENLWKVVDMLAMNMVLPARYNDHRLLGEFSGYRECHIEPDWLLVYKKEKDDLILVLTRTGTHSDLF